jgi:hypothetical protein
VIPRVVRAGVSLSLLAVLAWVLDAGALLDRLAGFDARWALLAIAISLPQVVILACRSAPPYGSTISRFFSIRFFRAVS